MPEGKTALVLSAGGMFGAYQAGVYAELENVLDPDLVVGASVGSLNGWMIASGCSGEELTEKWLNLGEASRVRWQWPKRFLGGCIDAGPLEEEIRRICSTRALTRELGVVALDLLTLRPLLFRSPQITWEHVAASCAVPFFLGSYRIDGRYVCDGGIVDPLPLQAAVEMGATQIIAVNLLKHRPWLVRQGVRALRCYSRTRPLNSEGLQIVEIAPSTRLGSAADSMHWSSENARQWIERGRRDAATDRHRVVECLQRYRVSPTKGTSTCPPTAFIV